MEETKVNSFLETERIGKLMRQQGCYDFSAIPR